MIPDAIEVRLTPKERAELEGRLRAGTTEQRQLLRIRIVLEAAEGHATREIARWLETTAGSKPPAWGPPASARRHLQMSQAAACRCTERCASRKTCPPGAWKYL
jgi:hypothetical protein